MCVLLRRSGSEICCAGTLFICYSLSISFPVFQSTVSTRLKAPTLSPLIFDLALAVTCFTRIFVRYPSPELEAVRPGGKFCAGSSTPLRPFRVPFPVTHTNPDRSGTRPSRSTATQSLVFRLRLRTLRRWFYDMGMHPMCSKLTRLQPSNEFTFVAELFPLSKNTT